MQTNPENAADANLDRRPGVPEQREPHAVGHAHWQVPDRQAVDGVEVIKDAQRDQLTPTFGTGPEPRGLSGVLRRAAYRIPDYEVKRWALLLFADRLDAIEGKALRLTAMPSRWLARAAGAVRALPARAKAA